MQSSNAFSGYAKPRFQDIDTAMTKAVLSNPLPTLALAGSLRRDHEENDRAWLKTVTQGDPPQFETLDNHRQGLQVAWRIAGSAPEPVHRGHSKSGAEQILLAGRSDSPTPSAEALLDQLDLQSSEAPGSVTGPCVFLAWSENTGRKILFRPGGGQRTLSYAPVEDGLLFASNSSCLALHPEVDRGVDWQAFAEQLAFGNIFGEKTLFRGIRRLEPGAGLCHTGASAEAIRTEWSAEPAPGKPGKSKSIELTRPFIERSRPHGMGRRNLPFAFPRVWIHEP